MFKDEYKIFVMLLIQSTVNFCNKKAAFSRFLKKILFKFKKLP
jgi:hypothetical protein